MKIGLLSSIGSVRNSNCGWRDSEFVCALADTDRHLGHLVKTKKWHAYDATHSNEASTGFKYLGAFVNVAAAKQAVDSSVAATLKATPSSRTGLLTRAAGQAIH
jgi:hypothetical protein